MTSRELAINILYKIENAESYSNIEIDKEFTKTDISTTYSGYAPKPCGIEENLS